ncbi:hypothetical protein [Aestuariivirga sp.]|uniref:hypothetical protein n=1 Tax=Aestuariivirga sp. TaxID=2650926 RepID=UPI003594503F
MSETADLQQDNDTSAGVPPSARVLLRVVYIMGIVLVLLFLTLVGGIIWKSTRKADPKAVAPPAALNLGLASGTAVQPAQIDGDRLVITTSTEIIVVDIRKNAVISRIAIGGP